MLKPLDDKLVTWLREKIQQACSVHDMIDLARKVGYSDAAIDAGIEAARPRSSAWVDGTMAAPPLLRRAPPTLRNIGAPRLDLFTLDGFLSADECTQLIGLISQNLQPSEVSHYTGDREFRVSQSALLCFMQSPLADEIDAKICRTLGIRAGYSEGVQAQRYDVGGHFKPHFDFFGAGSDPHRSACSVRGNRTWTFMVYLNDDFEGGATRFTEIDCAVTPKTGTALFWNNLAADGAPNPLTKHCGETVTRGHKFIITKWFRLLGDGPLFYE